jgi:nucleotide-binding universal stress UspA family protein
MVGKVLFVVDGSVPAHEAADLAHGLLPKAAGVLVLQVVSQLPSAWTAWPAFPDSAEDLAKAWAYVSEVGHGLEVQGWNVGTKVHFSVLSAGEMDREVLKLAETIRPDMICLALARGSVTAGIVREALVPVLVAKPSSPGDDTTGRKQERKEDLEPVLLPQALLLHPAGALVFRHAGML